MRRNTIRILPPGIIKQLAAGEVVETPASVVKELVANAIDAGATSILVDVRGGGTTSIMVADNGHGIAQRDLPLVFDNHSTSKLPDDRIDGIVSLGFRGEAMAAISQVAEVTISSRVSGDAHGWQVVRSHGGTCSPLRPCSTLPGTRVHVSDLFARQPARLRFLKGARAETNRVRKVMISLALAHPEIQFALTSGNRSLLRVSSARANDPLDRERLETLVGEEFATSAIALGSSAREMRISGGLHLLPKGRRGSRNAHISVNGHPVGDPVIASFLRALVRQEVGQDAEVDYVINLHVPPDTFSVNVHPRKEEVRFADEKAVRELLQKAITEAIEGAGFGAAENLFHQARKAAQAHDDMVAQAIERPLGKPLGQAHNAWIVCETSDGLAIIDQHAAHERIILERLKKQKGLANSNLDPVSLPRPVICPLPYDMTQALLERERELDSNGFRISEAGGNSILILAVPAIVRRLDIKEVMQDIAHQLMEGAEDASHLILESMASSSCKAAIKAGDCLSPDEIEAFIRELEATPNATRCIHGRASVIMLSNDDMGKLFDRT